MYSICKCSCLKYFSNKIINTILKYKTPVVTTMAHDIEDLILCLVQIVYI